MADFFEQQQNANREGLQGFQSKLQSRSNQSRKIKGLRNENVFVSWLRHLADLLTRTLSVKVENSRELSTEVVDKLDEVKKALKIPTPIFRFVPKDIQKVEVTNQPKDKDVQKVEVTSQPKVKQKEIQKVAVTNWKLPVFPKVEIPPFPKSPEIRFPKLQEVFGKVEVANQPKVQKVEGKVKIQDFAHLTKGVQFIIDGLVEVKEEISALAKALPTATVIGGGQSMPIKSTGDRVTGITKYDSDDSAPNYVGIHDAPNAATSDSEWQILKYTYSGSNVTQIQRKVGVWDDRASLF